MEKEGTGDKRTWERKLPKRKKGQQFRHVKRHYSTQASDHSLDGNATVQDTATTSSVHGITCDEPNHSDGDQMVAGSVNASDTLTTPTDDLTASGYAALDVQCDEHNLSDGDQMVQVTGSVTVTDSLTTPDLNLTASSNASATTGSSIIDRVAVAIDHEPIYIDGEQRVTEAVTVTDSLTTPYLNLKASSNASTDGQLDAIAGSSIIDRVAVAIDHEPIYIDGEQKVTRSVTVTDSLTTPDLDLTASNAASDEQFHPMAGDRAAFIIDCKPIYNAGNQRVTRPVHVIQSPPPFPNGRLSGPDFDLRATDSTAFDVPNDSFVGIQSENIMASANSATQYGLLQPMPAITDKIFINDAYPDPLPSHEEILGKVQAALPQIYRAVISNQDGIKIAMFADITHHLVVQRSIFAKFDGEFIIGVHGRDLPRSHDFWKSVESVPLTSDVDKFVANVVAVADRLRRLAICRGVEKYKSAWKDVADRAYADLNPFQEGRYRETCRSYECLMLVTDYGVKRCSECTKVWRPLVNANKLRSEAKSPSKFKGDAYCNSPEIKKRLAQQRKTIERSAKEIAILNAKIQSLLEKDGVHVEEGISDSLLEVITDEQHSERLTDIQKLFIEQQIEAARKKSSKGMTWHPAMIRIALSLRMTSAAAYEQLRGILHLPSERTLFNYSRHVEATDGINPDIIADLASEIRKGDLKPHQLLHLLMFDEIYIKRNLVFRKTTGEMVGYAHLLPVDKEIAALNAMMTDEVLQANNPTACELPLATKMLSYVVVGVCSSLRGVVACHGVANISAETLDRLTWEVVGALEANGLQVIALIADGAATNVKFFQTQKPMPGYPTSSTVYCTPNVFDPDRPVFLINDPPHLLKTTRNCIYSSGKISSSTGQYIRLLRKNGQYIKWDTVVRLYNAEKDNTVRKMFHINQADVNLNSYSVMNVNSAAHILSQSTADAIRDNKWDDSEEFAILCEKTNAAFDMMNGSYTVEGRRKNNPRLDPYENLDDKRFGELMAFWDYLHGWQEHVETLNLPAAEKEKCLLSRQTMEGWERSIKGFCGAVKYVLTVAEKNNDKAYVYARKFSQDYLEHFFGKIRGRLGGNRNPDLNEALRTTARAHVQRQLNYVGRKKGNTRVSKSLNFADLSKPLPKKPTRTSM